MSASIALIDPPAHARRCSVADISRAACVDGRAALARACADDDFASLYRQHAAYVQSCLRRFGVPAVDLDDVTQEVFVTVHARLDDYDRDLASMRSWLYGICRRRAANERRKGERRHRKMRQMPAGRMFVTEAELRRREAGRLIERFLSGLDHERGEVFSMIDLQGRSAPEVAQWLGISVNTVYSRLRAARHRFADFLRGIESEGADVAPA